MVQEQQRQETKTIKLGIWGTRSAGKTVYMLMLYHYLQRSKRKDRFLVKVGNEQTDEFLKKHLISRIYKGKFPTTTVIPREDKHNSYSYKLKRNNSDTIVELTFLDLPGELWEDREKKVKTNNTIGNKNYDTQCLCSHVCLILCQ